MKNRFQAIKKHFENEAAVFDKFFFKVMPYYQEMMQALLDALPFSGKERLNILDLGCGTGNLSRKLLSAYPVSRVTCVDMAENMLKMARPKFKDNPNVKFWLGDIRKFDYSARYDIIAASMVLHHVEAKQKAAFYRKLHRALSGKGLFFCIDIFASDNRHLQNLYMDRWKAFMSASGLPLKKINNMISRHQREDRPVALTEELAIMQRAGFKGIDVVLKRYNFAVYGGRK